MFQLPWTVDVENQLGTLLEDWYRRYEESYAQCDRH